MIGLGLKNMGGMKCCILDFFKEMRGIRRIGE
jgi:hypothetical protein